MSDGEVADSGGVADEGTTVSAVAGVLLFFARGVDELLGSG